MFIGFPQQLDKLVFEAQGASPQCARDWSVIVFALTRPVTFLQHFVK